MNSGLSKTSKIFAAGLILILFAAHQDFWNWGVTERSFGGLPPGFLFQVGLSIAAAFVWWIITLVAWPKDEWVQIENSQENQAKVDQAKTLVENPGGQK